MSIAQDYRAWLEKRIESYEQRIAELEKQLAAKAEPAQDDFEWQPVDAEHPLTAADHRRMVRQRNGEEWMMAWGGDGNAWPARLPNANFVPNGQLGFGAGRTSPMDIIAVLRPKPAPPAPEPPKPQPGEVWESELLTGGAARVGEIVSTRGGLVYLMDAEGDGRRRVAFGLAGDCWMCDRWLDRKLTRRVS